MVNKYLFKVILCEKSNSSLWHWNFSYKTYLEHKMKHREVVTFLFNTVDFCAFCLDLSLVVRSLKSNHFLLSFNTVRRNQDIFKTLCGISVVKYLTFVILVLGHSASQGGLYFVFIFLMKVLWFGMVLYHLGHSKVGFYFIFFSSHRFTGTYCAVYIYSFPLSTSVPI